MLSLSRPVGIRLTLSFDGDSYRLEEAAGLRLHLSMCNGCYAFMINAHHASACQSYMQVSANNDCKIDDILSEPHMKNSRGHDFLRDLCERTRNVTNPKNGFLWPDLLAQPHYRR
jgi:hypothetical protein